MALPRGLRRGWFSVKVTKIQPKTFELRVISPERITPVQFNDLIARVQGSVSAGDQLKYRIVIEGPMGRIELEAESIEEIQDQLNSAFPEWMTVIDQLSIDRSKTCITIATENIDEIIKRIYFKNVRAVRASS